MKAPIDICDDDLALLEYKRHREYAKRIIELKKQGKSWHDVGIEFGVTTARARDIMIKVSCEIEREKLIREIQKNPDLLKDLSLDKLLTQRTVKILQSLGLVSFIDLFQKSVSELLRIGRFSKKTAFEIQKLRNRFFSNTR